MTSIVLPPSINLAGGTVLYSCCRWKAALNGSDESRQARNEFGCLSTNAFIRLLLGASPSQIAVLKRSKPTESLRSLKYCCWYSFDHNAAITGREALQSDGAGDFARAPVGLGISAAKIIKLHRSLRTLFITAPWQDRQEIKPRSERERAAGCICDSFSIARTAKENTV